MPEFRLDKAFLNTSEAVASLQLCDVRLQLDARWPWLVLIPRRHGAREVEHLAPPDRMRLWEEAALAGAAVRAVGAALGRPVETINAAKIGNVTSQLHLHVTGRRRDDPLWPKPVWGTEGATAYDDAALRIALEAAQAALRGG